MKHWETIMMACVYNLSTSDDYICYLMHHAIHSIHARQHEINKIFHLIHQYTIEIIFYTSVHVHVRTVTLTLIIVAMNLIKPSKVQKLEVVLSVHEY